MLMISSRKYWLVLVFLLLLVPIPVLGQDASRLKAGKRLERNLAAGEKHTYLFNLDASQSVYGNLDQIGVDVTITVFNPHKEQIGKFDAVPRFRNMSHRETGRGWQERFQFETTDAGLYRIEVSPARSGSGDYVIEMKQPESLSDTPEKRTDQLLRAYYRDDEPGGVIAVVRDGEITYARAYGMANLTHGIPFTTETASNIGSVSKQFTGFAITLLEKEGKLSLDEDVRKYIPDFPDFGESITLLNLLNHTSGLRKIKISYAMKGTRYGLPREELIQLVQRQRKLQSTPGAEYRYSNTNYILLAEVVRHVTGIPFSEWMDQNVFGPLGMEHTTIKVNRGQGIPNSAQGYHRTGEGYSQSFDEMAFYGASSIYTTVGDLCKWLRNFRDARVGGPEVISRMTKRGVLTSGETLDYAFGLQIDKYHGLLRYSHGGSDGGHRTLLTYFPEIDAGIVLLNNERIWPMIPHKVTKSFIGEHLKPAEASKNRESREDEANEVDHSLLGRYTGRYGAEGGERLVVKFVREGSRLRAQVDKGAKLSHSLTLRAVSDSTFMDEKMGITIIFHQEKNGQVKRASLHDGEDITIHRLPPYKPSEKELSAYVGLYYSLELETAYTIIRKRDRLKLRHPVFRLDFTLIPKEPNIFTGQWGDYRFERNNEGAVSGFVVQNVRFEKLK